MTTGNTSATLRAPRTGTEQRLVEAMLDLVTEEGGSLGVNLRAVCRRVGCAHTNAYNYFDSYEDLRWAAFRAGLQVYATHLIRDLDAAMPADEYLQCAIENLASFPQENPGLYRFIGSDPVDLESIPPDVMELVVAMKRWFAQVLDAAAGPGVTTRQAREAADIVLAYIDGETLNLINGRAIAGEDLGARVVTNALRLFALLAGGTTGAGGRARSDRVPPPTPASILGGEEDVAS